MSSRSEVAHGSVTVHLRRAIEKLPPDAIAQIKSSIAINSINDAVLGLLKNSLDAQATKIVITVDFSRGSCTVEDNGIGINPSDFAAHGGLAKLYHTSKRHVVSNGFGSDGTFLASLSSLSFLSITSRQEGYCSVNRLILHNSKFVSRSPPSDVPYTLAPGQHGTVVSVRDLFGSMPVRVKQRADFEDRAELGKLCEALKQNVISIILAARRDTELTLQHGEIGKVLGLRRRQLDLQSDAEKGTGRRHSDMVQRCLSTLIDANRIGPGSRRDWIPLAASSERITAKGAISMEPAAGKAVQFITICGRPLSLASGHSEMFGLINKLFANSNFGSIHDGVAMHDEELDERGKSRRHRRDGPRTRPQTGGKAIERWPMFFFYVDLVTAGRLTHDPEDISDGLVLEITEVLTAMVTQWLESQGHRPRKRSRSEVKRKPSTPELDRPLSSSNPPTGRSIRLQQSDTVPEGVRTQMEVPAVSGRSKIRSGRPAFYETAWSPTIFLRPNTSHTASNIERLHVAHDLTDLATAGESFGPTEVSEDPEDREDAVLWQDPDTKEKFYLDSRTGTMLSMWHDRRPNERSTPVASHGSRLQRSVSSYSGSVNTPSKQSYYTTQSRLRTSDWLGSFLQTWDNPVFRMPEQRISRAMLPPSRDGQYAGEASHAHRFCTGLDGSQFDEAIVTASNRLSKASLQQARVVSQVDRKFILIQVPSAAIKASGELEYLNRDDLLVLIDQHAADERIKVESLLAELCRPAVPPVSSRQSSLGHTCRFQYTPLPRPISFTVPEDEVHLFKLHAAFFASWSILYELEDTAIKVMTLPSVVAERLKTSPQLLIKFLRSEIHSNDHRREGPTQIPSSDLTSDQPTWLRLAGSCPPGLLDLINSRACRSAIMFNDILDFEQCQQLLSQLAKCVFPFTCAHGRPSMVPIIGIGSTHMQGNGVFGSAEDGSGATAFKTWLSGP